LAIRPTNASEGASCLSRAVYPVNVEPGSAVVKGPYVAETLAVSVESDYVVVDL